MRVLYFTESLYPHVDGVSRTLARLFAALPQRGVDFRVVSPFIPGSEVPWADRVVGVSWIAFPLYRDYRVSLPGGRRVRRLWDAFRPDLVHLVSPTPMAWWAKRRARRRGVPVVASFHTHFIAYLPYYRLRPLERLGWPVLRAFYRGCARVYAPSPSLVRELRAHGVERVGRWSRGIDAALFHPARRDPALRATLGVSDTQPLVLYVGRLVREKDIGDVVATARALRARGVAFRLAFVGEGPCRAELERALPDAIFAGYRHGEELARWFASADVFFFPSTTETFGNVVLEAMASGLPAVVSDRGGPADLVIDGRTGFVVPAHDVVGFGDRLAALLTDAGLRQRMGTAARQRAEGFEWGVVHDRLVASYRAVVRWAQRAPVPMRALAAWRA